MGPATAGEATNPEKMTQDALRKQASVARASAWHSVALSLDPSMPVYGGGAKVGQADLLLAFRPIAIKNSLRDWWWQPNRQRYRDSSERLHGSMTAIWSAVAALRLGESGGTRWGQRFPASDSPKASHAARAVSNQSPYGKPRFRRRLKSFCKLGGLAPRRYRY